MTDSLPAFAATCVHEDFFDRQHIESRTNPTQVGREGLDN
jgi:hypothetical protein